MTAEAKGSTEPLVLLATAVVEMLLSGIHPHDRLTWLLEVMPILIFFPILSD